MQRTRPGQDEASPLISVFDAFEEGASVMIDLDVRGGRLLEVVGPSRSGQGFAFVPSRVEPSGEGFSPEGPFAEAATGEKLISELRDLLDKGIDALWVRARIKALFCTESPPETDRIEKSSPHAGPRRGPDGTSNSCGLACLPVRAA